MLKLNPRYDTTSDANDAISSGNAAINSFDPTTTAGSQQDSLGDSGLGGLLGGETSDYVSNYQKAIPGIYATAQNMYNVPQLASTATNLSNRLTDVIPNSYQAAKGFDIDSTDINNGQANATAYLGPQSGRATANYNTAAGLAQNYVDTALQPYTAEGTLLAGQEQAQGAGWNQAMASEFQGLIDKMNAGVTLSTAEIQRAQALAVAEEQAVAAQNVAKINQTFQSVPYANRLVNAMTGKTVTA